MGDLEESNSTRAVVVYAGAGFNRVRVGTKLEDVVRIAGLGLGEDVPASVLLANPDNGWK